MVVMKIMPAIVLMLLAGGAAAQSRVQDDLNILVCRSWMNMASDIMTERQAGKLMPDVFDNYRGATPDRRKMSRALIPLAFDRPLWLGDERKTAEISEFSNNVFGGCYKRMAK